MIKVCIIVTTDKQGGVVGDVKSESRDITKQEQSMLAQQRQIYLDLLKRQVDVLADSPPPT
jgi:hypothetical protein